LTNELGKGGGEKEKKTGRKKEKEEKSDVPRIGFHSKGKEKRGEKKGGKISLAQPALSVRRNRKGKGRKSKKKRTRGTILRQPGGRTKRRKKKALGGEAGADYLVP